MKEIKIAPGASLPTRRARIAWLQTYNALVERDPAMPKIIADEAEARFFLRGLIESEWNTQRRKAA